jgi:hypothetical protein
MDTELYHDPEREIKALEREMLLDKYKTAHGKAQFINDLKMGLGDEIKSNPGRVKIIKKTWKEKIVLFFKKIFTRF